MLDNSYPQSPKQKISCKQFFHVLNWICMYQLLNESKSQVRFQIAKKLNWDAKTIHCNIVHTHTLLLQKCRASTFTISHSCTYDESPSVRVQQNSKTILLKVSAGSQKRALFFSSLIIRSLDQVDPPFKSCTKWSYLTNESHRSWQIVTKRCF